MIHGNKNYPPFHFFKELIGDRRGSFIMWKRRGKFLYSLDYARQKAQQLRRLQRITTEKQENYRMKV